MRPCSTRRPCAARGAEISLRRRVQLLFVGFVLLVLANAVVDVELLRQRSVAAERIDERLAPASDLVSELTTALVDQETAERGYIITGEPGFVEGYQSSGLRVEAALDELERLLSPDRHLVPAVGRIRSRISAWQQLGAGVEIEARAADRPSDAVELVLTGTAAQLFSRARGEIETLDLALSAELAAERKHTADLGRRITWALIASAGFALLLLAAGGALLRRWIARPLRDLSASVRSVASGHLDTRIPEPGPPEIADLGADIEAMRRRILAEVEDSTRAREALAKQGLVVLSLRDELSPDVHVPGLHIEKSLFAAEGIVAGDWYTVFPLGDSRVAVGLFDVSGHGGDAGVLALRAKELTLAGLRRGLGPGEVFGWVAGNLGDTGERFFTGVLAIIDLEAGSLIYANAGHPPMLLAGGPQVSELGPTGPIVGPLPGTWHAELVRFGPGRFLTAYSDGVIEARLADGDELGVEGLRGILEGRDAEELAEIRAECEELLAGPGSQRQRDDLTLLLVAYPKQQATASPVVGEEPAGAALSG